MIKTAIIGCGRIGFSLEEDPLRYKPCTHLGAVKKLSKKHNLKLISSCDIDITRAEYAIEFLGRKVAGEAAVTDDYRRVIKQSPELLIIAASTDAHYEILKQAFNAGIPKVIVEKPVAETKTQARKLLQAFENAKSKVWVNYERRYADKYISLRKDILKEKYGRVLSYRGFFSSAASRFFHNDKYEGVLLHDTTHLVDLVQYLFGTITQSHHDHASENSHILSFRHSECSGIIHTQANSKYFAFELEILFEKARIRIGNGFYSVEKSVKSRFYKGFQSLSEPVFTADKAVTVRNNPFVRLYQEVFSTETNSEMFEQACRNVLALATR